MRTPMIAGNWKMNKTPSQAKKLAEAIVPLIADTSAQAVICPTFVCLDAVSKVISGTNIRLGAQNMHFEQKGAFTGEISAEMLTDIGVEYVIIGHSERRQYFAETDETVNKKALAALAAGLKPIICVGESLAQNEAGVTEQFVAMQAKLALRGMTPEQVAGIVIAYEPIWAIGTGKTATAEQAAATIGVIRSAVRGVYEKAADSMRILYGGSMNPKNAEELMAQDEIDGGLIGGAALKAEDFAALFAAIK